MIAARSTYVPLKQALLLMRAIAWWPTTCRSRIIKAFLLAQMFISRPLVFIMFAIGPIIKPRTINIGCHAVSKEPEFPDARKTINIIMFNVPYQAGAMPKLKNGVAKNDIPIQYSWFVSFFVSPGNPVRLDKKPPRPRPCDLFYYQQTQSHVDIYTCATAF
jgi:hypothetical protein